MQTEQEAFMREALLLAKRSAGEGEVPVGCVVVCDGTIVGRGRNRRESRKSALSHAELEAIEMACRTLGGWRLHRCDLYVTLEPCPMCAGAIIGARIRTVYYGASDEKAGSCGSLINLFNVPYPHRPAVVRGLLREECAAQLSDFFEELRLRRREERRLALRVHQMKLNGEPFALLASGRKTVELRLNDPKRQQLRVGDEIVFTNTENKARRLRVRVMNLYRFASFDELFQALPPEKCGFAPDSMPTGQDMARYYSKEKEEKYGVLGIEVEVIGLDGE